MELTIRYTEKNPYFVDGKWISGKDFYGFFLHDVATEQPDPDVWVSVFDKDSHTGSGINGFIGPEKVIITAPCFETPGTVKRMPHACRPANDHYIGFEMCNPKTLKFNKNHTAFTIDQADVPAAKEFVAKMYANAVELFARLCLFHGKDPLEDGVILSHREGGIRGIASDHGDPENLWNGLNMGYTMDGFRADVAKKMAELAESGKAEEYGYLGFSDVNEDDWFAAALKWAVEKKIVLQSGKPFRPNNPMDKATFIVLLRRAYNALLSDLQSGGQS